MAKVIKLFLCTEKAKNVSCVQSLKNLRNT